MSFDYPYTCPDIDRAIGNIQDTLDAFMRDLLSDACPLLSDDANKVAAEKFAKSLYKNIESDIEKVREANADIRKAAERQVSDLEDEIARLKREVSDLERQSDAIT